MALKVAKLLIKAEFREEISGNEVQIKLISVCESAFYLERISCRFAGKQYFKHVAYRQHYKQPSLSCPY